MHQIVRMILKSNGVFAITLNLDGFERDCPEEKFQTITS